MKYLTLALAALLCGTTAAQAQIPPQLSTPAVVFKINSTAFVSEAFIPTKYTCDSANAAPALMWLGAPANTQSFALIVEDPDAAKGLVTHWVAYNIAAKAPGLLSTLPEGTRQGKNSKGKNAYDGPCPPPGDKAHRYFFRLYALDSMIDLPPETTDGAALKAAIKPHVLGETELMGRYQRQ